MRLPVLLPLVLAGLLCATAFGRNDPGDDPAGALGSVFGVAILVYGLPALVRAIQRRSSEARRAEPFWTPGYAWAAFAIALVGTLGQVAQTA